MDKLKKGTYEKENFINKVNKSLMATWDEFDKEVESGKDEEKANLALMTITSLDTKSDSDSSSDSKEEDEVFSKLTHSNLITLIQDLIIHCQDKAKDIKILKKQYELVKNEFKSFQIGNEILEKVILMK